MCTPATILFYPAVALAPKYFSGANFIFQQEIDQPKKRCHQR